MYSALARWALAENASSKTARHGTATLEVALIRTTLRLEKGSSSPPPTATQSYGVRTKPLYAPFESMYHP